MRSVGGRGGEGGAASAAVLATPPCSVRRPARTVLHMLLERQQRRRQQQWAGLADMPAGGLKACSTAGPPNCALQQPMRPWARRWMPALTPARRPLPPPPAVWGIEFGSTERETANQPPC